MNQIKTLFLLVVVGAIAMLAGFWTFGVNGALIGLGLSLAFQAVGYFQGHRIALSFAHAQPLPKGRLPWLDEEVETLASRAGVPMPELYVSPDPQPNAFAAGRDPQHAVICVNQGLLGAMDRRQVMAVLAHEMGHIRNRDILTMTLVAALASFINLLSYLTFFMGGDRDRNPLTMLAVMLLAPIAAMLVQLAISRTREYAADKASAELMGDPHPMIDALTTLDQTTRAIPSMTAQPATAHMYVASPFSGGGIAALFRTHPSTADRIRALQALA